MIIARDDVTVVCQAELLALVSDLLTLHPGHAVFLAKLEAVVI